jgi:hypothetical protein
MRVCSKPHRSAICIHAPTYSALSHTYYICHCLLTITAVTTSAGYRYQHKEAHLSQRSLPSATVHVLDEVVEDNDSII